MKDLQEKAKGYFENYPTEKIFYVTTDGQFFTEKNKGAAYDHQNRIKPSEKPNVVKRNNLEASVENHTEGSESITPDKSWKNDDIKAWMDDHQIDYQENDTKKVMLQKIADADQSGDEETEE